MAARFAEKTTVSSEASRMEIERTLDRYGATQFAYGRDSRTAMIAFELKGRSILFRLPLPDRTGREFTHARVNGSSTTQLRTQKQQEAAFEQAVRQRWRALLLIIKAKLEAVAAGVVTIEDEFLAQTLLPDKSTVGDWAREQVDEAYRTGGMPSLLPGATQRALSSGK